MIDIKLILEKPEYVKAALAKKLWDFDPKPIQDLAEKRLDLIKKVEANKAEQNRLSASVPQIKKEGGDVARNARQTMERRLGRSVVTPDRASDYILPAEDAEAKELPSDS